MNEVPWKFGRGSMGCRNLPSPGALTASLSFNPDKQTLLSLPLIDLRIGGIGLDFQWHWQRSDYRGPCRIC